MAKSERLTVSLLSSEGRSCILVCLRAPAYSNVPGCGREDALQCAARPEQGDQAPSPLAAELREAWGASGFLGTKYIGIRVLRTGSAQISAQVHKKGR